MPEQTHDIDLELVRSLIEGWEPPGLEKIELVTSLETNPYGSRVASGIAEVLTTAGQRHSLLIKYGRIDQRTRAGSPWGPGHEVELYRGPLTEIPSYASPFLGYFISGDHVMLVLHWLDGVMRVNKCADRTAMVRTAGWLGRFHREARDAPGWDWPGVLYHYSEGVVGAWAELALYNVRSLAPGYPALAEAIESALPRVEALLGSMPTLVHGDFYPSNVLVDASRVIPVDWEWAGVGAGETDLGALIDGWPEAVARECVQAYREQRWPYGGDGHFFCRLAAGCFYLSVRSLGRRTRPHSEQEALRTIHHVETALSRLEGHDERGDW